MSKVIVYVLDKFVWMLIITVLTTQALQIAGLIEAPKGLGQIEYSDDKEYEYGLSMNNGDSDTRGKRQTPERSQLVDNIFNIPIATLNAVNNLVQSTRPAFQRLREVAQRRLEAANDAAIASQREPPRRRRRPISIYGSAGRRNVNEEPQPNDSNSKSISVA